MKKEWVPIMKKNKRLKLTNFQALTHYAVVLPLLVIVALATWDLIEMYVTQTYTGVPTGASLIQTVSIFLLLAVFFAVLQYRRLQFQEIEVTCTDEQFQEAVRRTVAQLEWRIERNNKTFFRAYRSSNSTGSWGEMVTILKGKDRLFINSICDPDNVSSVISYGWNKRNRKTFLKNLTDVLNDK